VSETSSERTGEPRHLAEPTRRRRLWSFAPVVAAALCIPCLVLIALFSWRLHTRANDDEARKQAAKAARTAAETLLAYDYRHIADDVANAQKLLTTPFSAQYAETTEGLKTDAVKLKAIVQANVKSVAVEDARHNRVVVLLFVDQPSVKQLPGQTKPTGRVDEQRVRMTMVRVKGHWRVSEVASLN
jgi:Mce-associated membrane protein